VLKEVKMERLTETTAGSVVVDFQQFPGGGELAVTVCLFDGDGWKMDGKTWTEKYGSDPRSEQPEPLSQFLAESLRLESGEAGELAAKVLGPWRDEWDQKGGAAHAGKIVRVTHWVMLALPWVSCWLWQASCF
jgi:hypothetical protein